MIFQGDSVHVVLVGDHPMPGMDPHGGVQRVVQSLRLALAKNVRVTLIAAGSPADAHHTDVAGDIIYIARPKLPGTFVYWNLISHRIGREIKRLEPDIIHVHDAAGYCLTWPRGAWGCPIVFTPHGMLHKDIFLGGPGWWRRRTAPMRGRLVASVESAGRARMSDVILISDYVLEEMPDIRNRVHHSIDNPVDELFLRGQVSGNPSGSALEFIQIGGVWPRKNTLDAIKLVGEINGMGRAANLRIVGPTSDPGYLEQCRQVATSLGLVAHVQFVGPVSPSDIVRRLDAADMLLLTSRQETAPMVVAEAQCRGVPTAVPKAFGLRFMVDDGVNGVFIGEEDLSGNASRLLTFMAGAVDRDRIARVARQRYDISFIAQRTIAVYKGALARQVPATATSLSGGTA